MNAFVTAAMPMASKRAAVKRSIEPARLRTFAVHSALADGDQNSAVATARRFGSSRWPTEILALVVVDRVGPAIERGEPGDGSARGRHTRTA